MKILYFARFRERLGCAEELWQGVPPVTTIQDLVTALVARGGAWEEVFGGSRFLASVNQEIVPLSASISPEDEVAFFPPVAGG